MPAVRTPQPHGSLLAKPLEWLTRQVIRFPVVTLLVAAAVAAGAAALAAARLQYCTKRSDLLSPSSDYHCRWLAYTEEFGDQEDVVVVIQGQTPAEGARAAEETAAAISHHRRFCAVFHAIDFSRLRSKGLYYLELPQLAGIERLLEQAEVGLSRSRLGLSAAGPLPGAYGTTGLPIPAGGGMDAQLFQGLDSLAATLDSGVIDTPRQPLTADGGRLAFVLLRFTEEDDAEFAQHADAIQTLRRIVDELRIRHPQTQIGLTGIPIIEYDEMQSSQASTGTATFLSLAGVILVFLAGFGRLRHPLLTVVALGVAMVWSMGFITLAIGHLNILSIAFAAILIGLGTDYGIYYLARYLQLRTTGLSTGDALVETARSVGPGILTGAVTTAGAFFMTGLTDFRGLAELGVIGGGGILLCWLAEVTVLPALICLCDRRGGQRNLPLLLDLGGWTRPLSARPGLVALSAVLATGLLATGLPRLWYDDNLMNLQPVGLESVELQQTLLAQLGQSAWHGLSIAEGRDEVLRRKEQCLALPSVERVEEIASALPPGIEAKRPVIESIHRRLVGLEHALRACPLLPAPFRQQVEALRAVASPEPPTWSDLPEGMVARFVGRNGKQLLKIYCKGDIWAPGAMQRFVGELRSVDPEATGNPVQIYEASRQMKQSYQTAALYAFSAVFLLMLLDFGSIWHTLLALLPLGAGMVQLFGLMGLLNIPLNPANMIVLPLILGLGVDYGIHVVHDFLRQPRGYQGISGATATALVINALTTMVGFGSLMVASHQGLQSLGRVLTIGITCCLVSAMIAPCLIALALRTRRVEAARGLRRIDLPDEDGSLELAALSLHHPRRTPDSLARLRRS